MVGEEFVRSPGGEIISHPWLPPTRIEEGCTSMAGYPDGRHHTLVKAAEARLAFQMGAVEIALMPNPDSPDDNAVLAEAVAVREAVPHPASLLLFVDLKRHNLEYLAASGVDGFVIPGWGKVDSPIPVVRLIERTPQPIAFSSFTTPDEAKEAAAVQELSEVGVQENSTRERIVYLHQE